MKRWILMAALSGLVALAASAQDPRQASDLRQHNTGLLRMRGLDRAVVLRGQMRDGWLPTMLTFAQQIEATMVLVEAPTLANYVRRDAYAEFAWRRQLNELHRLGLSVYALVGRGDPKNPLPGLYSSLDMVARLGVLGLPGENFDGVIIDDPGFTASDKPVATEPPARPPGTSLGSPEPPPPSAPVAAADQLTAEVVAHLGLVERARRYLSLRYGSQRLALGLVLPAWLSGEVVYDGRSRPAYEHLVDLADLLVVHNQPFSQLELGEAAATIIAYAGQRHVPTLLRLDFAPAPYGRLSLTTLGSQDQLFAEQLMSDLLDTYENNPGFGGFALNDWSGYLALPPLLTPEPLPLPTAPINLDSPRVGPR